MNAMVSSEPVTQSLAAKLAHYALALRFESIDAATLERVKTHVIDTIGCGVGAFHERPVKICREVARAGAGPATVLGTDIRTSIELASFANCAAFRYLDFNDTYIGRFSTHPSDLIAACIAVAEAERSNARELIVAIVIAYEVNCRLVDACDISTRGWDPTVMSPPAVALAVGRLMKLSHEQLTHAVSIAINDHVPMAQTRVQTLSDWKGLSDAEACRNAVFAAVLARHGLTGPAPIFEGRSGFFQQLTGPATIDVGAFGGADAEFRINRCSLKRYPAVIYTQTAVVAGAEVARQVGTLENITAIEIETTKRGLQRTGSEIEKWSPETRDTADHSMPYITARAMFDGDITHETFEPHMFRDPRILHFMKKISVKEDQALTARQGAASPTRVTAILSDGRRISHEADHAPGFANCPMTRSELEKKFRGNVGAQWSPTQIDSVLATLWKLDEIDDIAAFLPALLIRSHRPAANDL
jgi:2-methylcitrate dehydratase